MLSFVIEAGTNSEFATVKEQSHFLGRVREVFKDVSDIYRYCNTT